MMTLRKRVFIMDIMTLVCVYINICSSYIRLIGCKADVLI